MRSMRVVAVGIHKYASKTRAVERCAILIDLATGLGIPPLQIPLQYIVPGHRHNIFDDIGCLGETYETPLAVVLFHLPPSSSAPIKSFYNSRAQFRLLLSAPASANLANRYLRLIAPASTGPLLTVPPRHLRPILERRCHRAQPLSLLGPTRIRISCRAVSVETLRWATVACALLLFEYFVFADEAIKTYRGAFNSVAKHMGYTSAGSASGSVRLGVASPKFPLSSSRGASATLPVFIRKDTTQKRDSFDSFSNMSALYGSVSPLEYEDKEKALTLGEGDAHTLSLVDVGGMLPDYKVSDYSSSPSSSSSASSSASSDTESRGEEEGEIEVSSLHRTTMHIPSLPEPAHTRRSSGPDVPMPAVDAADIV
ncbi:pheromone A receptor-domain-containing protein [Mycena leptocephala]|nr:pheromone A receptor-domain-containing protein [Mycena leptocephala]